MDYKKMVNGAKSSSKAKKAKEVVNDVVKITKKVQNTTDKARNSLSKVKSKAKAAGLGGVFDKIENAAEKKLGIDLDKGSRLRLS